MQYRCVFFGNFGQPDSVRCTVTVPVQQKIVRQSKRDLMSLPQKSLECTVTVTVTVTEPVAVLSAALVRCFLTPATLLLPLLLSVVATSSSCCFAFALIVFGLSSDAMTF